MRKLTILLALIIPASIFSQNISVKSFKEVPNDMTARVTAPVTDQNGEKCALIKIRTTQKGFVFEGDMLGITKTIQKVAEIWMYVPNKVKKLTIKHQELGILDNYLYPITIKEATVYVMELTTARVITTVEEIETPMQWLTITSEPKGADVYINNNLVGTTPYAKKMEIGKYNYRIEKFMYHKSAGAITLTQEKKEALNINLKPNFGYVKIITTPESGAKIEIDHQPVNNVPYTSQKLLSGKHTVLVKKVMFQNKTVDFEINDAQTTNLNIDLNPNFAEITIETRPQSDIYIDDEKKGTGTYTGRLMPGLHTFEAKKDKHKPDKKQLEFVAGENRTLSLHPLAKTGKVDIVTTPFDATIKLNNKNYGTTPNTIKDLLIGDYTLTLEKVSYGTITKTITIKEGETTQINETLPSGKQVTINSQPQGAQLYISGQNKGTTPYTATLGFGDHAIKLINGKKTVEQIITVSQTGKNSWNFDVSEFSNFTENTANLNLQMVAVKGGNFKMGSNNGGSDEKPIHSVTVSDFYIGKYEVTQKQWKKIMGTNPSYFKGDNLPVEKVSWNDIQKFIKKLNAKTGKNYRLPTEAEWEYAARGGSTGSPTTYAGSNYLGGVAWYSDNSGSKTHRVGTKQANELGIYDMTGNVWEWCSDWYGKNYYRNSPQYNPQGPGSGSNRVIRGGSWGGGSGDIRCAVRNSDTPQRSYSVIGFRLAKTN